MGNVTGFSDGYGLSALKRDYDVAVVGAGPAGAVLAYDLAKKGIGVLVLEKERLPRHKCCAGGVTVKAAGLLDFDISDVVEDVVHESSITYNFGDPYLGHSGQPLIYMVRRDMFDYLLVQKALGAGAVVIDGQNVRQIRVGTDLVEISTAGDVFRSRLVAGADGAYSVVARELDMRKGIEYIAGICSEVLVSEEELLRRKSRFEVDMGSIPGGYGWVFPKGDRLSIGAGCPASKAKGLGRRYREFLDSLGLASYGIARSGSHLIPTRTRGPIVCQDRALLLGDAAGLADPLTGEGIYNAIKSAQLAVPVIEDSLLRPEAQLQAYQRVVEEIILSELKIARVLARLYSRFPHPAFRMLSRHDKFWSGGCRLMRGEINYAIIKERLGGPRGMLDLLLGD